MPTTPGVLEVGRCGRTGEGLAHRYVVDALARSGGLTGRGERPCLAAWGGWRWRWTAPGHHRLHLLDDGGDCINPLRGGLDRLDAVRDAVEEIRQRGRTIAEAHRVKIVDGVVEGGSSPSCPWRGRPDWWLSSAAVSCQGQQFSGEWRQRV